MDVIQQVLEAWAARRGEDVLRIAAGRPEVLADDRAALCVAAAQAQTGQPELAEPRLIALIQRGPVNLPQALAALCRLYHGQGREADLAPPLAQFERVATANPQAGKLLGDFYMFARQVPDAHRAYAAAWAGGFAPAQIGLAETWFRMGSVDKAIAAARGAAQSVGATPAVMAVLGPAALCSRDTPLLSECLRFTKIMRPSDAAAMFTDWTNLLVAALRVSEATQACEMLVAQVENPESLRFLADMYLATHDIDRASATAQRALDHDPADPLSMAMLARCKSVAGDTEGAMSLLKSAIAVDANAIDAYDFLSHLRPEALDEAMCARLDELRRSPSLNMLDRSKVSIALARTREIGGKYEEAFELYLDGKRGIAKTEREAGRGYTAAVSEATLRVMRCIFTAPIARDGADMSTPIFIIGLPRSGTSLTEQILAAHHDVQPLGESPEMVRLSNELLSLAAKGRSAADVLAAHGHDWARRYVDTAPKPRRAVTTDKHPSNVWSVGLIFALFPNARVVHLVRDPLDTCLSIFTKRFYSEYAFANDLDSLAHYYACNEAMMGHWRSVYGDRIHDLSYEALTSNFEATSRALVGFCGLPWDDACLSFHRTERAVFTHSAAQVREPIHKRSLHRAVHFGEKLRPLKEALDRYRGQLGG